MQRKLALPLWITIVMLGVSALDASAQSAAADPIPPGLTAPAWAALLSSPLGFGVWCGGREL
jgi:hypothetical protein